MPSDNDSYSSAQANMGLMPPGLPMYSAKHPGDFSAQITQQAIFQNQQVAAMGMQTRSFSPLATMNPFVQVGNAPLMPMPSAAPNMLAGMGPPTSMFSPQSFSQGMSPYQAMPQAAPAYMGQTPPMMPFPFSARLPPSFLNTPYASDYQRNELYQERQSASHIGYGGTSARMGTDLIAGGIGALVGSQFKGVGAAAGGLIGFGASEIGGLGQFGQNAWMNTIGASQTAMAGRTAGVMDFSRNFVTGGPFMSEAGSGFSRHAAFSSAQQLTDLAGSSGFQSSTGGRFNTNDVFRIAQTGAENGMMTGVGSPHEMVQRVKEVSKSLRMVMELAQEPDVRQAIQTMGSLRGMGLNLAQTTDAVMQGRSFARQAGMTFQQLAATGGAMGSQTFASMGLTQGQGFLSGTHAVGSAQASINQGILSPQMAALVGGAQGYGAMNTAFTGQFMQSPVWAAMLNRGGGLSTGNLHNFMSGNTNMFNMTAAAGGNMGGIAGRMGVEGMGMMLGMQHFAQDSMLSAMTPGQQRRMEDNQVMSLSRSLGYRGGAGFMTAAQMMGATGDQAMARLSELSDPRYYDRQRSQIDVDRRERGSYEAQQRQASQPGFFDYLTNESEGFRSLRANYNQKVSTLSEVGRIIAGNNHLGDYDITTAREAREEQSYLRSNNYRNRASSLRRSGGGGISLSQRALAGESEFGTSGLASTAIAAAGGLSSLFGSTRGTNDEINTQLQHARESADIANSVLNTNARQQTQAIHRVSNIFGTGEGGAALRAKLAQEVAHSINNTKGALGNGQVAGAVANGAFAGLLNLTSGSILAGDQDISGLRTGDLEARTKQAFLGIMRSQGKSTQESEATWRTQRNDIMASISGDVNARVNTIGQNVLNVTSGHGVAATPEMTRQRADDMLRGAYGHALGEYSGGEVSAFGALLGKQGDHMGGIRDSDERIEGVRDIRRAFADTRRFGRSEAQQTRSGRLMEAMATARLGSMSGNEEQRKKAQRQYNELAAIGNREFGDDFSAMQDIVTNKTRGMQQDPNARRGTRAAIALTENAANGGRLISTLQDINESEAVRSNVTNETEGFERVRRLSGNIRGILGGASNTAEALAAVQNASPDRLREMASDSRNPMEQGFARAALAAQGGNENAFNRFFNDQGKSRSDARKEFERRKGHFGFGTDIHMFEDFDEYDVRKHATGGAADLAASNETAEVSNSENTAGAQGLLRATDNFSRVVNEFHEAVREMRSVHDINAINQGINQ